MGLVGYKRKKDDIEWGCREQTPEELEDGEVKDEYSRTLWHVQMRFSG